MSKFIQQLREWHVYVTAQRSLMSECGIKLCKEKSPLKIDAWTSPVGHFFVVIQEVKPSHVIQRLFIVFDVYAYFRCAKHFGDRCVMKIHHHSSTIANYLCIIRWK